jgi:hypothetical protein
VESVRGNKILLNRHSGEEGPAVTAVPGPELSPCSKKLDSFRCRARGRMGGSDGGRLREIELFVPRRIAVPDFRTAPAPTPRWPSRHDRLAGPRYHARARRLTPAQESTIRALAGTRSLRSQAANFGVSHVTIRAVLGSGFVVQATASHLGRPAPMNAMARRDTVASDQPVLPTNRSESAQPSARV